jgi:cysteinyl-tRNA synthetase
MSYSVVYALQGVKPSIAARSKDEALIIDRYNDEAVEWTRDQIIQMGGGAADPRLLYGYLSLGEAEDYRAYWQSTWAKDPPSWLGPENPQWEGNYSVKFWSPEWLAIVKSYLDAIMAMGFDGVFFDVVDVYEQKWVIQHARADPAQGIVSLVKSLSDYARGIDADFKIYVNNAEELLANKTYLNAIDGILKENLYHTDDGQRQPRESTAWSRQYLDLAVAAGKNVSVVEYVSNPGIVFDVRAQAEVDGYGHYTTNIDLIGINQAGFPWVGSTGDDVLRGSTGDDVLRGSTGDDVLGGGDGDDVLIGGLGRDVLRGGSGADEFDFNSVRGSRGGAQWDVIGDFMEGVDKINLATIDAEYGSRNQRFHWVDKQNMDVAFTNDAGELRYSNGILSADPNGDGKADFQIKIIGKLTTEDVIL